MKITKIVKLEMSREEKEALKTVYRMLDDLDLNEERIVADELDYSNLEQVKYDLACLYNLSGESVKDL